MKPKIWTPGTADEAWKVIISANNHRRASETLATMVSILSGARRIEDGLDEISKMSGDDIVKAMVKYRDDSIADVERGLKNNG